VEIENHFILECEAFKHSKESYADTLATNSWDNLFIEGFVEKLGVFIVRLHKKRDEYKNQIAKKYVP